MNKTSENEEIEVENTLLEYGFPHNPFNDDSQSQTSVFSKTQEFNDASIHF